MGLLRSALLAASQNQWLRRRVPRYRFVRRTVARFMPGETLEDALSAAQKLQQDGLGTVFTRLGENITAEPAAEETTEHYLHVLDRVRALQLGSEISVKLTQIGLDLDHDRCYRRLERLIEHAGVNSIVWIDMESSQYVDATLDIYRRARERFANVGVCLQAYLRRTSADLDRLLPLAPAIRLVKGAYREPREIALQTRREIDENFIAAAQRLLAAAVLRGGTRTAIATHDPALIRRVAALARDTGIGQQAFEFQMLYGIQRGEQLRLAKEGWRARVLIAYGDYWYPWFMRRLAERPANLTLAVRNLFGN